MVWRLSHITIDELPVARVLDEVAYLRHGPAHDTADMRRQEQRLTAQEKDRAYFRETREKRLGATLEAVSANRETDVLTFRKTLEPVRAVLVPHRAWPDLQRMKILLPSSLCRRHRGRSLLGAIKPAF
jgi:hypothetical protein